MTRLTRTSYIKIALVSLLCLTICGVLTGAIYTITSAANTWNDRWNNNSQSWITDPDTAEGGFSVDASTVKDISLFWLAGNVAVNVVDDRETDGLIQVKESDNARPALRWRAIAGKLEIDYGDVRGLLGCSSLNFKKKDLTILIPKSRAKKLENFSLDIASGEYRLNDLTCKKLSVNQASGRIRFDSFSCDAFFLNLASGSFSYQGHIADAIEVEEASGNALLQLDSINPKSATFSLASGEMKLLLPQPGFRLNLDKLSGNFNSDFDLDMSLQDNTYYSRQNKSGENTDEAPGGDSTATSSQHEMKISMEMMSGNFFIGKSA